jgi:flagellar FliL protein
MASEQAESTEKKPSIVDKIKKLLPVFFIVLNFGVCGAGVYMAFLATIGWEYPALTEAEEMKRRGEMVAKVPTQDAVLYTMDKFTVNLNGTPQRIIQTEVSLEMLDEKGFEEVVTLGPQARDEIVRILNGKSFSDIETIQGKLFLKDQIASSLNQILKTGVVRNVYFSEFIVQ